MNVGVVGATGMVGEVFLNLMEERKFPVDELRLFASEHSAGETRRFCQQEYPIRRLSEGCFEGLDLVFFSSGEEISREWAPKAVTAGAFAVDNSAAFRMHNDVALIVPEVNGNGLAEAKIAAASAMAIGVKKSAIIANPNCSTIQLVLALNPLACAFGIQEVRVASYQAVSGAGRAGSEELRAQCQPNASPKPQTFPYPIAFNCLPQIGPLNDDGFCTEEMKIIQETRKILNMPDLRISAFTVRVPVFNAHSEAVWVTLKQKVLKNDIHRCLRQAPGLELREDGERSPTAREISGTDAISVGRVHRDLDDPCTWLLWVVGDNLRKGAALNGLQIAGELFDI